GPASIVHIGWILGDERIRSCRPSRPSRYSRRDRQCVNTEPGPKRESHIERCCPTASTIVNCFRSRCLAASSVLNLATSEHRIALQRRSLANARDGDDRARKRGGRGIGGHRKTRTAVRRSHMAARWRRRSELAERTPQGEAVAARNCTWVRERGKAQSYLCRRSSAQRFQ